MEVRKAKKIIVVVLVLVLTSMIAQCASKHQVIKEDDEAILRKRVQEYWSYRIKGEWDKTYLYESSDYRQKTDMGKYINQNARAVVKWEGFDILELWTSGQEGYVRLNTKSRYLIPRFHESLFDSVVEEKWIKKDGKWYHA